MKARQFTKLRAKYQEKNFVEQRLLKWANIQRELVQFKRFECDSFFRGETLAELNRAKYNRESAKCWAKIRYYKKLLNLK